MARSLTIIYEEDDKKLVAHGGIPDEVPPLIEESKFNAEALIYDDILKVVGQSMLEKIIELEASKKFSEAAEMYKENPQALRLRELQTYQEIGTEHNTLMMVIPETMATPLGNWLLPLGVSAVKKEKIKSTK